MTTIVKRSCASDENSAVYCPFQPRFSKCYGNKCGVWSIKLNRCGLIN